jgi:hypothetical protein
MWCEMCVFWTWTGDVQLINSGLRNKANTRMIEGIYERKKLQKATISFFMFVSINERLQQVRFSEIMYMLFN